MATGQVTLPNKQPLNPQQGSGYPKPIQPYAVPGYGAADPGIAERNAEIAEYQNGAFTENQFTLSAGTMKQVNHSGKALLVHLKPAADIYLDVYFNDDVNPVRVACATNGRKVSVYLGGFSFRKLRFDSVGGNTDMSYTIFQSPLNGYNNVSS